MPGIDHAARLVEQIAAERRPILGARPKSTNE
jgi:hypothetical protein